MTAVELSTDRLLLRGWRESDREPWAALNADPRVRRYFPGVLTRAESDEAVDRYEAHFAVHEWGLWALELRSTGEFIGFAGLWPMPDDAPVAPAVEVGWRLSAAHWGQGLAPEAARAALDLGFSRAGMAEIVAQTTVANAPSRRVMEKLGMTHDPADDFSNPRALGTPCEPTVLYRLAARDWTTAS